MENNIKRNFFRHIARILKAVEKSGDNAKHFRCIVLMGDHEEKQGFSFLHASSEDLKNLILSAMRNSEQFTYAAACAFQQYDKELREERNTENQNTESNEEDNV